ncbi:hypothetical protein BDF14DRAFT_1857022 [Spinellus fusiger]|nr:hypothetical protein BDF14DRAFT_1857022 [Spinellus fusiger]
MIFYLAWVELAHLALAPLSLLLAWFIGVGGGRRRCPLLFSLVKDEKLIGQDTDTDSMRIPASTKPISIFMHSERTSTL